MRLPKLAATCSTSDCATATATSVAPRNFRHVNNYSAIAIATATSSSSSSSGESSSSSSLESNLSIQTLPSVPSLQKLISPLDTLNLSSISHQCTHSFKPFPDAGKAPINCLAIHASLLYVASSNLVAVYDLSAPLSEFPFHVDTFGPRDQSSGSVKAVAFAGGDLVLTAHQDSKVRTWKIAAGGKKRNQHRLVAELPTVADRILRSFNPRNYVRVRRHKRKLWIEHADAVTGLAVDGRHGLVYSISWDKTLKAWDSGGSHRCLESVNAHEDAVNAIVVSPEGGTVYTGSADCKIRVWARAEEGGRHSLLATLEKHKSAVNALALNGDGSVLFSGACDRSILVWEREDSANYMAVTGALRGHGKAILCLVSVSGFLLSGSADRTVRVWTRGGEGRYLCLAVLDGHSKPVKSLAGFWDGENGIVSVFSGGLDGEVKAWRVSGGPCLDLVKLAL